MIFIIREFLFVSKDSKQFSVIYGTGNDPLFRQLHNAERILQKNSTAAVEIEYFDEDFVCSSFRDGECEYCAERKENFFQELELLRELKKKNL
jgi:acyl-homoserine lactone acylase PvdQ